MRKVSFSDVIHKNDTFEVFDPPPSPFTTTTPTDINLYQFLYLAYLDDAQLDAVSFPRLHKM